MISSELTSHDDATDELSTVDWRGADRAPLAFACRLIQHCRKHPTFRERSWMQARGDIVWRLPHGAEMEAADWQHGTQVVGALVANDGSNPRDAATRKAGADQFFVAINASEDPAGFRLPAAPVGRVWERVFDSDRGCATGVPVKVAPMTSCSVAGHALVVFRRRG